MKPILKFLFIALAFVALASVAEAQSVRKDFYNSTYGSAYATDTVTNGGTGIVQSPAISGGGTSTVIWVTATEISGTTGGTITLQGSLDGTNWKAIMQPNLQTAVPTITATDVASNTYHWWLSGSPFRFYRVSWTGTGTMSATLAAEILKH